MGAAAATLMAASHYPFLGAAPMKAKRARQQIIGRCRSVEFGAGGRNPELVRWSLGGAGKWLCLLGWVGLG